MATFNIKTSAQESFTVTTNLHYAEYMDMFVVRNAEGTITEGDTLRKEITSQRGRPYLTLIALAHPGKEVDINRSHIVSVSVLTP